MRKTLIFIIFLFLPSILFAQNVGKFTMILGNVEVLKGGKLPAVPAKVHMPVYVGDVVRTKADSKAEIVLVDATVIKIAPRTRVDISEYVHDERAIQATLAISRGKVGTFVSKATTEKIASDPKTNRFEVKTPVAVAGVRGTNYIVSHYANQSVIVVLDGRVYCYNTKFPDRIIELREGQKTVVKEWFVPRPPMPISPIERQREERGISIEGERATEAFAEGGIPGDIPVEDKGAGLLFQDTPTDLLFTSQTTPPITETQGISTVLTADAALGSIEATGLNEWVAGYKVVADAPVNVRYRLKTTGDWGEWVQVNETPSETVNFTLGVNGTYELHILAEDNRGRQKEWIFPSLSPIANSLSGNIKTDTGASSELSGFAAGATGFAKGVANLSLNDSVSFSSSFVSGGGEDTTGYWIFKGSNYSQNVFTSSNFKLLTQEYFLAGNGLSTTTLNNQGELTSLKTEPWLLLSPLTFSAKFSGAEHHYNGYFVEKISGKDSVVLIGRTGLLSLPTGVDQESVVGTENYGIGYIPTSTGGASMTWGTFQNNPTSILKMTGYAGGMGGGQVQDYVIYGLYVANDGSVGILKGLPSGQNQILYEDINILDIEPSFTFKRKSSGYTGLEAVSNGIKGTYQGLFTGGSGDPQISQKVIEDTSQGMISSKTLYLKGGDEREPWGVFGIEMGGSHSYQNPSGFKMEFSGTSWDNRDGIGDTMDYWVGSIKEAEISGSKMSGIMNGKFISPTHYGQICGRMLADIWDDSWVGITIGSYEPISELSHYSPIVSTTNDSKVFSGAFSATGARIDGAFGGDGLPNSTTGSAYMIGKIQDTNNEIDFSSGQGYLWFAPINWSSDSSRYAGYVGGRFAKKEDTTYNLASYVSGIYNDSSNKGIFLARLSTEGESNVLQLEKAFFAEGEDTARAFAIEQGQVPLSQSPAIIHYLNADPNNYGITISNNQGYILLDKTTDDYTFGAGIIGMGGAYNNAPSGSWEFSCSGAFEQLVSDNPTFGAIIMGEVWGVGKDLQNIIQGKTYAYFGDTTGTPFKTGIFVGETIGTFDPSEKTWQTVTIGSLLETEKFLHMACPGGTCNTNGTNFTTDQQKLRDLSIPVIEVGRASFSGSGNNLSVNMNNVVFFSTNVGQKPVIWSTADVSGTYTGGPETNVSIQLTGSAGSVYFTPIYWENSKWAATVKTGTDPVNLSGGSYQGQVHMNGLAAGSWESGTFSGTASGIAK